MVNESDLNQGRDLSSEAPSGPGNSHVWRGEGKSPQPDELLDRVMECATNAIATLDPAGNFTRLNQRVTEITGYRIEELIGRQFDALLTPEALERIRSRFARLMTEGAPVSDCQTELVCKDGSTRTIRFNLIPLVHEGRISGALGTAEDISEQRRAETALHESEERFRAFMDNSPAVAFMKDEEGRYVYINRPFERLFKVRLDDMRGKTDVDYFPEETVRQLRANDALVLSSARPTELIEAVPTPDGNSHHWLVLKFPFKDHTGRRFVGGVAVDITERDRAEEAIRESEERFRIMANTAPVMIWMSGPDAGCTFFNQRWLEFTGRPMEEQTGEGWARGVHPEDLARCTNTYLTAFKARCDFEMEYRLRRADGEYRWIRDFGTPLRAPSGDFVGYIGSCVDVTEHKKAEEALRKSEDRYRDLVENSGVLFGTHDLEGKILSANRPVARLSGYEEPEELIGRNIRDFLAPEVKEEFDSYLEAVIGKGHARGLMKVCTRNGEERILEYSNSLRREGVPQPVVRCIGHDVTERKRAEQALRKSEERLRMLLETTNAIPWEASAETWRFTYVAPGAVRLLGYPLHEWYETDFWSSRIHPEDRQRAVDFYHSRSACCEDYEIEYRMISSDNRVVWIHDLVSVSGNEGRSKTLRGFMIDVTERKRAEEALRESEERYRLVAQNSQDLIGLLDIEGTILYSSPSHVHVLGYTPEELFHHKVLEFVHPDDQARAFSIADELLSSRQSKTVEFRVQKKPGDWVPVEAILSPIADDAGTIKRVLVSARDITERKRAEQVSLSQTAAITRTLNLLAAEPALETFLGHVLRAITEQLDAPSSGLHLYHPGGNTVTLHMAYQDGQVLRGTQGAAQGVFSPEPLDREDTLSLLVNQGQRPLMIQDAPRNILLRAETRAWALAQGIQTVFLVPLLLGDKVIGILSVRSRERRTYRSEEIELAQALAHQATLAVQLTRLAEQARQSLLLEERNRMAREIHDTLAQGLAGIVIQLEAAEDALGRRKAEAQKHISQARRLARESLAEARRSVWALRPRVLERAELASALQGLVEELTEGTESQVHFVFSGTSRPLPTAVENDLLRISQEAVTNALKHARAKQIEIELAFPADSVQLSVKDDGQGFDPQSQAAGRGFGLTSIRERAERAGGRLSICSQPGRGTQVKVVVPTPSAGSQR